MQQTRLSECAKLAYMASNIRVQVALDCDCTRLALASSLSSFSRWSLPSTLAVSVTGVIGNALSPLQGHLLGCAQLSVCHYPMHCLCRRVSGRVCPLLVIEERSTPLDHLQVWQRCVPCRRVVAQVREGHKVHLPRVCAHFIAVRPQAQRHDYSA